MSDRSFHGGMWVEVQHSSFVFPLIGQRGKSAIEMVSQRMYTAPMRWLFQKLVWGDIHNKFCHLPTLIFRCFIPEEKDTVVTKMTPQVEENVQKKNKSPSLIKSTFHSLQTQQTHASNILYWGIPLMFHDIIVHIIIHSFFSRCYCCRADLPVMSGELFTITA